MAYARIRIGREILICSNCYWFHEDQIKPCSNGKIYPCSNIGVDGWKHWTKEQEAPSECSEYCRKGEYTPTGIWADVTKVINKVSKAVEENPV